MTRASLKVDVGERDIEEIFNWESMGRGPKATIAWPPQGKARDQYDRIRMREEEVREM